MKPLCILKTGSTYEDIQKEHGDFEDWISNLTLPYIETIVVDAQTQSLPELDDIAGIVATGSPCMVTDQEPWMIDAEKWIVDALKKEIPYFGICFGHQLLAHAAGGVVDYHPKGREIGTHEVELTEAAKEDVLFEALPKRFAANLTHGQSVLTLPSNAVLLAKSAHEAVQAFRIGRNAWAVQFHPEFDSDVMEGYLNRLDEDFKNRDGKDKNTLIIECDETPDSECALVRYAIWLSEQ